MIEKIKNLIEKSNSIAIFFHVGPDGDAVGSALALKEALNNINKSVTVFSQDEIGNHFEFLNTMSIKTEIVNDKFDLGFVLDCGDVKRIGTMVDVLKNCKDVVNIDHHLNNENFTDYKIINTNASSTCEIMFYLLKDLNIKFNKQIKLSLYTGLATDSGCFMYGLNEKIFKVADELTQGINNEIEKINYILFREKSFDEIKLTGEIINKLESHFKGKFAMCDILQKDLKKYNVPIYYTPSIIFLLSGLANFDVICIICEEKEGVFRVSFRSSKIDVCGLARLFGGGGHKFASGCKIYGTKNTVKKNIIEKVKEYLKCME